MPKSEYIETPNMANLILQNNINKRIMYRNKVSDKTSGNALNEAIKDALSADKKSIIEMIRIDTTIDQKGLAGRTRSSRFKVQRNMVKLADDQAIFHDGGETPLSNEEHDLPEKKKGDKGESLWQ